MVCFLKWLLIYGDVYILMISKLLWVTYLELYQLNKIRIALQLITLSDITDSSDRTVLPYIYNGVSHWTSSLSWPHQLIVNKSIPLWKRACKNMQNHLWTYYLGNWISTHQQWKGQATPDQSTLCIDDETYNKTSKRWNNHFLPTTYSPPTRPTTKADVYYYRGKWKIFSLVYINYTITTPPTSDAYSVFFPNHELPPRLKKK